MENFLEYYNRLFSDYLEENTFGTFEECIKYHMINEGLITSYPKEKVTKFLESLGGDVVVNDKETIDALFKLKGVEGFKKKSN